MITIKSSREIETMAAAGRIVAATLAVVEREVAPGVTPAEVQALTGARLLFAADLREMEL